MLYFKYYYFINSLIFTLFKNFLFSICDVIHDLIHDLVHDLIPSDPSFVDARSVGAVKP